MPVGNSYISHAFTLQAIFLKKNNVVMPEGGLGPLQ